jgi:DNA-binding NarL/FixJ family response regulator
MHLELLVTELGYEVCGIAVSDLEAIAAAAAQRPDVVLMDIRLANGSSGVDAARKIHAVNGLRCIFLSGNLDEETRRTLEPYEPIGFVGKPILQSALRTALRDAEGLAH